MSRAAFPSVQHAPKAPQEVFTWAALAHTTLWNASRGKINAVTDDVTLATGTVTTALQDPRLAGQSFIKEMPLTAAARAEGPLWYSGQDKGVATINHTNSPDADRTFRFLIIG